MPLKNPVGGENRQVQGVMRRGMTVEALQDFVLTQGMSKAGSQEPPDPVCTSRSSSLLLR